MNSGVSTSSRSTVGRGVADGSVVGVSVERCCVGILVEGLGMGVSVGGDLPSEQAVKKRITTDETMIKCFMCTALLVKEPGTYNLGFYIYTMGSIEMFITDIVNNVYVSPRRDNSLTVLISRFFIQQLSNLSIQIIRYFSTSPSRNLVMICSGVYLLPFGISCFLYNRSSHST